MLLIDNTAFDRVPAEAYTSPALPSAARARMLDAVREDDPFRLARFVAAQERDYARAFAEIRAGRKTSHWMWYIFPQIVGLGSSPTSQFYAIAGAAEARAYLDHPLLGPRLVECAAAVLAVPGRSARQIFGDPDDLKLRSSATLFAAISAAPSSLFQQVLDKYFNGSPDAATLHFLEGAPPQPPASDR
jgi:uncharacterized protein (DUF1810 family)